MARVRALTPARRGKVLQFRRVEIRIARVRALTHIAFAIILDCDFGVEMRKARDRALISNLVIHTDSRMIKEMPMT